jgi:hypothetical protein
VYCYVCVRVCVCARARVCVYKLSVTLLGVLKHSHEHRQIRTWYLCEQDGHMEEYIHYQTSQRIL